MCQTVLLQIFLLLFMLCTGLTFCFQFVSYHWMPFMKNWESDANEEKRFFKYKEVIWCFLSILHNALVEINKKIKMKKAASITWVSKTYCRYDNTNHMDVVHSKISMNHNLLIHTACRWILMVYRKIWLHKISIQLCLLTT